MARMRGADIVAELLARLGVRYVSGIPGHTVIDFVDAVFERQDRLKALLPRNEETASYAADAFYRVSHQPMAVFGHISVGSANLLTGVANAAMDSSAMIVITGEVWTRNQGRGAYQELSLDRDAGTPEMFRGSVKRSWQVNRAEKLPEIVLKAYKLAVTGRPGPVHLDITQDAFSECVEVELPEHVQAFLPAGRPRGDAEATAHAVEVLLSAQRPAILAGGGVLLAEATSELMELAELLQAPVGTTIMGKGAIPEDHPLAMGIVGWVGTLPGNQAMRDCDVLLALGTRFSETDTSGWTPGKPFAIPPTRLVHVDIDPNEIARYYPVEVGIVGDVRAVLRDLVVGLRARLGDRKLEHREWLRGLEQARVAWHQESIPFLESDAVPVNPGRLVSELRRALPRDGIVVCDVGNAHKWLAQQFTVYQPRTVLSTMGGAAMGFGPSGAIGAQLAAPNQQVVCWVGDGSMSMSLHALPTTIEHNLPIVFVVVNDNAYGAVKRPQDARFGPGRNLFSLFRKESGEPYRLDFAAVARAMGMEAERVSRPEEIAPALQRALSRRRPYLLDVDAELNTYVPMSGGGAFVLPPRERAEEV